MSRSIRSVTLSEPHTATFQALQTKDGQFLKVKSGDADDGTPPTVLSGGHQLFCFDNGYLRLQHPEVKVLAIPFATRAVGAKLVLATVLPVSCRGDHAHQHLTLEPREGGWGVIRMGHSGLILEARADGVVQTVETGAANQFFKFVQPEPAA